MSDRDFENYLTLLSSLLRLDRKQRQSIAEELRSHLEDRLDDLTARGVAHDEAIKQALAEFGDAAGLAGQFVAISQNRKRRWLMRLTTFSIAATLLLAAGLALLWPARNAAPGAADLVAQETKPADQPSTPQNQPPAEPTLEEKLNQRLDVDFANMPLKDAIAFIQESTGIQFVIRTRKLEEAALTPDMPVNRRLKRVRISTLLDLLLDEFELTYVDKDDLILITTYEDAEATLQIRVYDCRDLLAMAAPRAPAASTPFPMIPVVPVVPTIPPAGSFVSPPPTRAPPVPVTGYLGAVIDQSSADKGRGVRVTSVRLGSPAQLGGLQPDDLITAFDGKPIQSMEDFDEAMSKAAIGRPVHVRLVRDGQENAWSFTLWPRAAAQPAAVPAEAPAAPVLALPPPARTSSPAPNSTLPQLGGLETAALTQAAATAPAASASGQKAKPPHSEEERRTGDLMELVMGIVDPETWDEVGGPGSIDAYNGLVVVAQTAQTHKKVERLFDMLREAAGLEVPKTGKVVR